MCVSELKQIQMEQISMYGRWRGGGGGCVREIYHTINLENCFPIMILKKELAIWEPLFFFP